MENHGYCVTTPYRDKSQIGVFRENLGDIWAKCQNLPHSKAKNPHGYGLQYPADQRIINLGVWLTPPFSRSLTGAKSCGTFWTFVGMNQT